jgi:hypothetical protein
MEEMSLLQKEHISRLFERFPTQHGRHTAVLTLAIPD